MAKLQKLEEPKITSWPLLLQAGRERLADKQSWTKRDMTYTNIEDIREPFLSQMITVNTYMYTTASNLNIHEIPTWPTKRPECFVLNGFCPRSVVKSLHNRLPSDIWVVAVDRKGELAVGIKDSRFKSLFGKDYTGANTVDLEQFYLKNNPFVNYSLPDFIHFDVLGQSKNDAFWELDSKLEKQEIKDRDLCSVQIEDSMFGRVDLLEKMNNAMQSSQTRLSSQR
jgi:hypothetical protein